VTSDRLDLDRDGVPWPLEPPPPEPAEVYPFPTADADAVPVGESRLFPRVDLAALARQGISPPQLVCDRLLYRGGLHSLAGPPDSGKSTLLYLWTLQLLSLGEPVVLLDEEAGRELAVEKLLALGATPELLAGLVYVEFPARGWDEPDRRGLARLLAEVGPALIGFDSAGAFLAQAGLRENEAAEVTGFYKGVLLPAARQHQAAVVVLDHVTKQEEASRYARGSGAKLQLVDVALMVEPITRFSRHQGGLLKLQVAKDRRGYLARAHQVRIEVEDGRMALSITEQGAGEPGLDDPDLAGLDLPPAARKLLVVLRERRGEPLVASELVDRIKQRFGHGLGRQTVSTALNDLAKRDLVDGEEDRSRYGEKRWWAL
jgi:KaiC/GvpD/RAD55 family RecA-like ATPase